MNALAPMNNLRVGLGDVPCEGYMTCRQPIPFDGVNDFEIDLSALQATGHFSSVQTIYIDNHLNGSQIDCVCNDTYQTFVVPPGGMLIINVLVDNPPKFVFSCAASITVAVHFMNFVLPPLIWGPTLGGGGGGITTVTPNDVSGAAPLTIPANAARKGLVISNPVVNGASIFVDFAGGATIELTTGALWDMGPVIWMGVVNVTAAGAAQVNAYEGT